MKWVKYTVKTVSDAADIIAASLYDLGFEGVEIEESRPPAKEDLDEMFADFYPDYESCDDTAFIHFYLESDHETENRLTEVMSMLESLRKTADIGEGIVSVSYTEDKDWINSWKEYFHKFSIDDILIVPSWESAEETDAYGMVLHIDPGTAFGTGMHETTRLAIKQLRTYVKGGDNVLDIGTGSGILGIVALKSGAACVKALDIDPNAVPAVKDNLSANDIDEGRFDLTIGNIITDESIMDASDIGRYDIVTANILADVLTGIAPVVGRYLKPGARVITSGILENKTEEVIEAFGKCGFSAEKILSEGEWVSVAFQRKE